MADDLNKIPPVPSSKQKDKLGSSIDMIAPWAESGAPPQQFYQPGQGGDFSGEGGPEAMAIFVKERSRVHEVFIREQAKNKRIGLILAFVLIILASLLVLFAPDGRQTLSYWIGGALIIFAAGASGFGRVWGKAYNFSFGADRDRRSLND
jgi:hypothetical protein